MNQGEKRLCEFQAGTMDQNSFFGTLFKLIAKADVGNRYKLQKGFPEEVGAHIRWTMQDGYAQELMAEYNRVGP